MRIINIIAYKNFCNARCQCRVLNTALSASTAARELPEFFTDKLRHLALRERSDGDVSYWKQL